MNRLVLAALSLTLAACGDCNKPPAADADGGGAVTDAMSARDGDVVNVTPVPTASVAKMVNPDNLPVYTGETGSVEGTVTITGDPPVPTPFDFSMCRDAEKMYGVSFRKNERDELADAIVVVTGYKGFLPEKSDSKLVTIEGCGYTQRTVTLTFGQRLDVKNLSKDFWSPVLEPNASSVMMMAVPNGDPVKIYPKKPGHWLLLDHDRKYVVVDVYAFLHPLHTATDVNGHFRIDGVPVGHLSLGVTHPRFDAVAKLDIDVKPGVVQRADVVLVHKHVDAGAAAVDAGPKIPMPH